MKEYKIILDQSLLTGWLAIGIVNLVSNFIKPSWVGPWNEVGEGGASSLQWSDTHEGKNRVHVESTSTSVSEGPEKFAARELTY